MKAAKGSEATAFSDVALRSYPVDRFTTIPTGAVSGTPNKMVNKAKDMEVSEDLGVLREDGGMSMIISI